MIFSSDGSILGFELDSLVERGFGLIKVIAGFASEIKTIVSLAILRV